MSRQGDIPPGSPFEEVVILPLYKLLKKEEHGSLKKNELKFITEVEEYTSSDPEKQSIDELLQTANSILAHSGKYKEIKDAIAELIKLDHHQSLFGDVFKDLNTAFTTALNLDYSKKNLLKQISKKNPNVFGYAAYTSNLLIGKMEASTVSKKIFDKVVEDKYQNQIVCVIDGSGNVRYVNSVGSTVFEIDRRKFQKGNICDYVIEKFDFRSFPKDANEYYQFPNVLKSLVPVTVMVYSTNSIAQEITEYLVVIERLPLEKEAYHLPTERDISSLNYILAYLMTLKSKIKESDTKLKLDELHSDIRTLREVVGFGSELIENDRIVEFQYCDLKNLMKDIAQKFERLNIRIKSDVAAPGIISNKWDIEMIVTSLIIFLSQRNDSDSGIYEVNVSVSECSNKRIAIVFSHVKAVNYDQLVCENLQKISSDQLKEPDLQKIIDRYDAELFYDSARSIILLLLPNII